MELYQWVGVASGSAAVLGAVIGSTKYFTQLPLQSRIDQLDTDLKRLQGRYAQLEESHETLRQMLANAGA
ncbi:MAG: hypothetical protein C4321_05580, partial [Chloroflexota bacterium]